MVELVKFRWVSRASRIVGSAAGLILLIVSFALAQEVTGPKPGDIIPGRYLVTFQGNGAAPDVLARRLGAAHGFRVLHVYRSALMGMAIEVPAAAQLQVLDALRLNPGVRSIGNDRYIAAVSEILPTGVDRVEAEPSVGANSGSGIRVAVVDTGLDLDHPDLADNIAPYCFTAYSSCQDDNGHGTFVGGIIAAIDNDIDVVGAAPDATLIAVKVLDDRGSGSFTDVIAGLDYLAGLPGVVEVANMSLGATCSVCTDDSTDPTVMGLHEAVVSLVGAGTTVVVAAGNNAGDAKYSIPAAFDEVITVSALVDTDGQPGGNGPFLIGTGVGKVRDDTFAPFSNYGTDIDVTAPGTYLTSLNLGGGTSGGWSGTSFSAPHAAAVAAIFIRDYRDANAGALPEPGLVRQALIQTGECYDGNDGTVFHDGIGCDQNWPKDPDTIPEPMVRADNVVNFGPPPEVSDVAVSSVNASSPVLVDIAENITVAVVNNGTSEEVFYVMLEDDDLANISGPQSVTLAPGASDSLIFSWTATSDGDHILTATALVTDDDGSNDSKSTTVSVQAEGTNDVAVTSISAPNKIKTEVKISVQVANEGTFDETFTVDVIDTPPAEGTAGTVSDPQTLTLTAGSATTLSFTWNTAGASTGDHLLTATASIVAGEVDIGDNSKSTTRTVGGVGGNKCHPKRGCS
ncbi:MAG: S8 family serine peptidase [Acidimicrobiia bacterium]